jgi:hypothetical protein
MHFGAYRPACFGVAILFAAGACLGLPPAPRDKTVWNYDGGVMLRTNGSIPDGPCFRIAGRVDAPSFFDNLKRVDTANGTIFRRGSETLTEFPEQVLLTFVLFDHYDETCPPRVRNAAGSPVYLSREIVSSLRLSVCWKRGVELQPVVGVKPKYFSVDPVIPDAAARVHGLPEKLVWSYEFTVPSAGVPLTDSLVLILRTPDGHIAARVAARL